MKRILVVAGCTLLLSLTGCSTPQPVTSEPTAACGDAFDAASFAIEALYASHPFYGDEYDALYADGEITESEQVKLDEWMADEQAQFAAINEPLYDACQGSEDFYAGAYAQGDRADWALEGNEAISTQELKKIFLSTRCRGQEQRMACADFKPSP